MASENTLEPTDEELNHMSMLVFNRLMWEGGQVGDHCPEVMRLCLMAKQNSVLGDIATILDNIHTVAVSANRYNQRF